MALLLKGGGVFLHIPKTGGNWVNEVLQQARLVKKELGFHKHIDWVRLVHYPQFHSPWRQMFRGSFRTDFVPDFSFCFVRHPMGWYESWWKYMSQSHIDWKSYGNLADPWDWHPNSVLNGLGSPDFTTFVRNVLKKRPGCVSEMYGWYAHPEISFVGKQENLKDDLVHALQLQNLNFDEDFIRNFKPVGVSKSSVSPVWEEAVKVQVLQTEQAAIQRYGYET